MLLASSLSNWRGQALLYDARASSYENCNPVLSQFSHSSADLRLSGRIRQYIDKGTSFLRLRADKGLLTKLLTDLSYESHIRVDH